MLSDAINYPFQGEHTAEILVIGGGLSLLTGFLSTAFLIFGALTLGLGFILFPIALVPLLGVHGYYVRVLESTAEGTAEPPEFNNIAEAFKDGLFAAIIGFVYYLVPLTLIIVFSGVGGVIGSDVGGAISVLGMLAAMIFTVALTYVYPVALIRYALKDNVGAAFAFDSMQATLLSTDYLTAWLFGFVILAVGSGMAGVVALIPFVGWVVAPVIQFLVAIMAYRAFGVAYTATNGTTQSPAAGAVA